MKIDLIPDKFSATMETVTSVIADKLLREDMKSLIMRYRKDTDVLHLIAYNQNIMTFTEAKEAKVTFEDGETPQDFLLQVGAKEINNVISATKGLQITRVTNFCIHVKTHTDIELIVSEEPIDTERENAEKYYKDSSYRLKPLKLGSIVQEDITKAAWDDEGAIVPREDLLLYLSNLLPTVAGESKEGMNGLIFTSDHVYTVPATYAATMPNKLPEDLQGFRMRNTIAAFMKDFVEGDASLKVSKKVTEAGEVTLKVQVADTVALIKMPDNRKSLKIEGYLSEPENGVALDKGYFADVIKRLRIGGDSSFVEINVDEATMYVSGGTVKQEIPLERSKGHGVYRFNIRNELLYKLAGLHADMGLGITTVFIYLRVNDRNKIEIACSDSSRMWHNMMLNLEPASGAQGW